MSRKTSLVLLALSLVTLGIGIDQKTGISIPLKPRAALTKDDGTFDHERAAWQTYGTQNKHRQNLINLERNVGLKAFNKGAEIKKYIPPPSSKLTKRQGVPLTDQDDAKWTGPITIGSNAQKFTIDFDTGSADLWVPNARDCDGCYGHKTYDSSTSKTSKSVNGEFIIYYGDESTVSGPIFTDTVSVAGVNAMNQTFSAVTQVSSSFNRDPGDGILGLAYESISSLQASPYFQTAFAQKAVPRNEFAFKLAAQGSELFLGGTNSKLFTGTIEYHPVKSSTGFWQIGGASIQQGGTTILSEFDTVIDSGTTIMYGPPDQVRKFYSSIAGSELYDESMGFYSFPCKSIPEVAFSWGGQAWGITTQNFNLGETYRGSGQCVGALSGKDLGLGSNVWLLGDSFMKNVYTVFSFANNTVGYAMLK
ncbi:hypothetical protein NLI96_g2180 [Meripilus lineatus]|uniref:Peptidase A1 domain-containing protein n=1 Tax=Meripilus lineatus TaxID=2056292 RepID=A0AAD5YK68_9APHY|nr:hypothetical protein NLI96_g2180 [Physisporinus lineatus]